MKKIPDSAKRVFKGMIFDVYQWEQEMFDGSFETFELLKRPNTVLVLPLDEEGNVLYAKQEQPNYHRSYFSVFGGRSEEGEDPLETGKRELLEESGLVSDDWKLLNISERSKKIDWKVYFYIAKNCKVVEKPKLDSGEKIEILKTSLEDFVNNIVVLDSFKEKVIKEMLYDFSDIKKQFLVDAIRS